MVIMVIMDRGDVGTDAHGDGCLAAVSTVSVDIDVSEMDSKADWYRNMMTIIIWDNAVSIGVNIFGIEYEVS